MLKSVSFAGLLRRGRVLLGLSALSLLAACGGSVSRVETFAPQKLVVFGDEMSLLPDDSSGKYGINALVLDANGAPIPGQPNCAANPVWPQYLAAQFGLVFKGCPGAATVFTAEMHAAVGAKVAAVAQQVAAYRSGGGTFTAKTLVTVQGGMYDIKAAYDAVVAGTLTRDQAIAQIQAAGTALANVANGIIDRGNGGRVLYVSVPSLALSPYGLAENAIDPARGTLLKDLTNSFNDRLRAGVLPNDGSAGPIDDGRYAGPVFADTQVANMANPAVASASYALADRVHPACTTALPACTTATLQLADSTVTPALAAATSTNYLWADAMHLGPAAHTMIGAAAVTRAVTNPF